MAGKGGEGCSSEQSPSPALSMGCREALGPQNTLPPSYGTAQRAASTKGKSQGTVCEKEWKSGSSGQAQHAASKCLQPGFNSSLEEKSWSRKMLQQEETAALNP